MMIKLDDNGGLNISLSNQDLEELKEGKDLHLINLPCLFSFGKVNSVNDITISKSF